MSFHKTPLALSVFLLGVLALLALAGIYYFNSTQYAGAGGLKAPETAPDAQHVAVESEDAVFLKFSELSNAKTNFCAGPEVEENCVLAFNSHVLCGFKAHAAAKWISTATRSSWKA